MTILPNDIKTSVADSQPERACEAPHPRERRHRRQTRGTAKRRDPGPKLLERAVLDSPADGGDEHEETPDARALRAPEGGSRAHRLRRDGRDGLQDARAPPPGPTLGCLRVGLPHGRQLARVASPAAEPRRRSHLPRVPRARRARPPPHPDRGHDRDDLPLQPELRPLLRERAGRARARSASASSASSG